MINQVDYKQSKYLQFSFFTIYINHLIHSHYYTFRENQILNLSHENQMFQSLNHYNDRDTYKFNPFINKKNNVWVCMTLKHL